ncbi:MAG: hypothetical protein IT318_08250 [Anaerolineales bacterium]|nr:hypothetical protein [Anaerolineales bacterium]
MAPLSVLCAAAFSIRPGNAAAVLRPAFRRVEARRYPGSLWVAQAQPLVD